MRKWTEIASSPGGLLAMTVRINGGREAAVFHDAGRADAASRGHASSAAQ
jgi:hypothetical protein